MTETINNLNESLQNLTGDIFEDVVLRTSDLRNSDSSDMKQVAASGTK